MCAAACELPTVSTSIPTLSNGTLPSAGAHVPTEYCTRAHRSCSKIKRFGTLVNETTAHGHTAAATRFLWPLAGPWTGGDGPVEDRALRLLQRLPRPSPSVDVDVSAAAAASPPTRKEKAPRSANRMVLPLAEGLWVDSRWGPSSRTRPRSSSITCTGCVDCVERRAVHVVSWAYRESRSSCARF